MAPSIRGQILPSWWERPGWLSETAAHTSEGLSGRDLGLEPEAGKSFKVTLSDSPLLGRPQSQMVQELQTQHH